MTMQASDFTPKKLAVLTLVAFTCLTLGACSRPKPIDSSSEGHLQEAKQLIQRGDYQAAFLHLNEALRINPQDPQLHRNMGWLYLYTDEPEKATEELKKLESLRPDAAETDYLAGAIYSYLDQHKDAVAYYQKALAKKPENPQLYYDLATSLGELNQPRDAIQYFEAGMALLPKDDNNRQTNFLYSLCTAHYALKEFDKAAKRCDEAMALTTDPQERGHISDFVNNLKLIQSLEEDKTADNKAAVGHQ